MFTCDNHVGCQFLTANDFHPQPLRIDNASVQINTVDAHESVKRFCAPAYEAVKSVIALIPKAN